jgi:hypothetical protein
MAFVILVKIICWGNLVYWAGVLRPLFGDREGLSMPFFVGQLVMVLSGLPVEIFHFL